MKKINLFIIATSIVGLLSCSTTNAPLLDDDTLFEEQTRGEISQNDSTKGGGVNTTFTVWTTVSDTIVATEVPKDDVKNDSIPCDSIARHSIPTNELTFRI